MNICLVMYAIHTEEIDKKIVASAGVVDIFIANTQAGMWHTLVTPQRFQEAGIKVFSYGDGSYESRPLPENLSYIDAIAKEGCKGFFLDQVSSYPSAGSEYYLKTIYEKCKKKNLLLMINTGVANWSDNLMKYCDYIMSNESWFNTEPSPSQLKWQSKVIIVSNNIQTAEQAIARTKSAWQRGFPHHYSCSQLNYSMPDYYAEYIKALQEAPPVPPVEPSSVSVSIGGVVVKIPVVKEGNSYISNELSIKLVVN